MRGDRIERPPRRTRTRETAERSAGLQALRPHQDRLDDALWFLGPATYRSHVGEKPMAMTWELHTPLPGDLYQSFAEAVA